MDNKIIKCINVCSSVCAVIVMIVIFVLSSHNAEVSTNDSKSVIKVIHKVTQKIEHDNVGKKTKAKLRFINDGFIRRIGHILEYTGLSFFLFFAVYNLKRGFIKSSFLSLAISCVYAISDEIHQYFIPGRACEFVDFCKDTLGAILGCLICGLILIVIKVVIKYKKTA